MAVSQGYEVVGQRYLAGLATLGQAEVRPALLGFNAIPVTALNYQSDLSGYPESEFEREIYLYFMAKRIFDSVESVGFPVGETFPSVAYSLEQENISDLFTGDEPALLLARQILRRVQTG
ncbi:hypothetical protein [Streptomyces sp. NPDC090083]|uniref:hypothetical protein n=1 Tax=Streptomyces sp. NPDC090083 TaxID=3365941 RepID=UPI003826E7AD